MKLNSFKTLLAAVFIVLISSSCQKDRTIPNEDESNNVFIYNKNRLAVAKALINVYNENPTTLNYTIINCFKYFDGDRNVLLSDLIGKTNYAKSKTLKRGESNNFKRLLNYELSHNLITLKSSDKSPIDEIVEQNPLMQLYYYIGDKKDTLCYSGIVLLEDELDEQRGYHTLVTNDGEITNINRNIAPTNNYMVLSMNERNDHIMIVPDDGIYDGGGSGGGSTPSVETGSKTMKILRAKFVSLNAKRMFESWAAGEPEVRLNVNYASIDKGQMSARNTTYYYPKSWIGSDFFSNWTTWNNSVVTCPTWYKDKHSFERNIMFTEEDGKSSDKEYTQEYTNPITGIKST